MNTSELRIGNWVSSTEKWKGQINEICENWLRVKDNEDLYPDHMIHPIELTPHVMSRIKGVKLLDNTTWVIGQLIVQWYDSTQKTVWINNNHIGIIHLEYLHELQNLYYSLTGKELEVEL